MNAKKAKKLRKAAEIQTVGKPYRLYTSARPGADIGMVHPETTRGTYKRLKKWLGRMERARG